MVVGERVGSRCHVTDSLPWLELGPRLAPVDRAGAQSAGRIEVQDGPELNRALLAVHAAREMPEFWEATRRLLHSALPPLHFTCMCVRPFAVVPPTIFRECAPFASEAEFKRFQAMNPMQVYLGAHPGATVVRMSEVLEDRATYVDSGDLAGLIAAAEAATRPAPPPPPWTWHDAARATWQVYEEALAAARSGTVG